MNQTDVPWILNEMRVALWWIAVGIAFSSEKRKVTIVKDDEGSKPAAKED